MMHHSSRLHLTRDSVYSHVCTSDLQSASKPLTRFSSSEYVRALNSQVQRFPSQETEVPERTLYLIDKLVRLRTKEAKFGFDHSEVLNIEREMLDPFVEGTNDLKPDRSEGLSEAQFSKKLMERLSRTVPGNQSPQLNFDDWKRKKEAEIRLKRKLIDDAAQEEAQKRIEETEAQERRIEESQRKAAQWEAQKRQEAKQRELETQAVQRKEKEKKGQKQAKAEEQFKTWLRENFTKLKEKKRMEKAEQRTEAMRAAEKQRLEEERKWQCEQQFQDWLRRKAAQMSRSVSSVISKPEKPKKPIMLAYSPNRRLKTTSSPTSQDNPSKYTSSEVDLVQEPSSTEPVKSTPSSAASLKQNKGTRGKGKRAEDVQPIEELSSIQRTSHQGGHFASGEEDVEGFIYSGNEDESSDD